VVVYDNFNFKDTVRDEYLGNTAEMKNLTTGAIVLCPELPPQGLTQDMHDPSIPLTADLIVDSPYFTEPPPSVVDHQLEITDHLICEAISRVHGSKGVKSRRPGIYGVDKIFQGKEGLRPTMPTCDRVPVRKTEFVQLAGIHENEGTIAGTYRVQEDIFLNQLKLPREPEEVVITVADSTVVTASTAVEDSPVVSTNTIEPPSIASPAPSTIPTRPVVGITAYKIQATTAFSKRLWLIHGDQLTCQHCRACQHDQTDALKDWDRREWYLPVQAWFHVSMNLMYTIVRTHCKATAGTLSSHALADDWLALGYSDLKQDRPEFHKMDPFLAQVFSAKVLALFYAAMQERGLFKDVKPDDRENIAYVTDMIGKLSVEEFASLREDVRIRAFTQLAWEGKNPDGTPHKDSDFTTMCRLVQEIETFLTLRHAIRYGDIGLLRRLVDPLAVIFFGAGQHNYGREMLYLRWNLTKVNAPELQHAILASGLVNWTGKPGCNKAIDLSVEHLNSACKIEMKCYKNSTHDTDLIFDRVVLTNTPLRHLRDRVEGVFGEYMPGLHTYTDHISDIHTLARKVFDSRLARPRPGGDPQGGLWYTSPDILHEGAEALWDEVKKFNGVHVYSKDGTLQTRNAEEILPGGLESTGGPDEAGDTAEDASYEIVNGTDVALSMLEEDIEVI
jgi:hypothetical protein